MIRLIENEKLNTQINHLFKLNSKGMSDQEIADFFTKNGELNLKIDKTEWSERDIRVMRQNFQLAYNSAIEHQQPKTSRTAPYNTKSKGNEAQLVVITDIDMPFFSMIKFMVKWAIASIPAIILLGLFIGGVGSILSIVGVIAGR